MTSKKVKAGVNRLLRNQRIFQEGDLVQIDLNSKDQIGVGELLNEFGPSTVFEVVEIKEPLGGYGSGCPQIIFICYEDENDIIQEEASNFILVQNPVAA